MTKLGRGSVCVSLVLAVGLLAGCRKTQTVERTPSPAPSPTYTGPAYLRGTVGSLVTLRNAQPMLVSGYGLVVNLNGTGSAEVPAFLRQYMLREMRKQGVGSARLGWGHMPPERVLADPNTAVVVVQGLIPPGATKGTRFDLLVSALDSQTTSLAGGTLWTAPLAVGGANPQLQYSRPVARGRGDIYVNPFDSESPEEASENFARQAVIVAGGVVDEPRRIDLMLNQPSWTRSRLIADRINERFPAEPGERAETAKAVTDLLVEVSIPRRFANRPDELLALIGQLYVQRAPGFEPSQARYLAEVLQQQPDQADTIVYAWRSLGKNTIPVLREHYGHEDQALRLAALRAGAALGDERASEHLAELAGSPDADVRQRVAEALVYLPKSFRGGRALAGLLDDPDRAVRIAAYESLARNHDPMIDRLAVSGEQGVKFLIDRVPAERPLVYVTQEDMPRLVIFGPQLGFDTPTLARLWGNDLMIRARPSEPAEVYYQPPHAMEPRTLKINPTLATLAFMLAHRPSDRLPQDGLDLTYSQVIDAVYYLCREGHVPAPIELRISPLAQRVTEYEQRGDQRFRPETGEPEAPAQPAPPDGSAGEPTAGGVGGEPVTQAGGRSDTLSETPRSAAR